MATPTATPTFEDIRKLFPDLSQDTWENMPEFMRNVYYKSLSDLGSIDNAAKGTPIPTPPKKATPTPTPSGAGVANRYGRWVKDPGTAEKYYLGDPRFEATIKAINKLGGDLAAYLGEDLPPTATPVPKRSR
jgi:hypothetical protein